MKKFLIVLAVIIIVLGALYVIGSKTEDSSFLTNSSQSLAPDETEEKTSSDVKKENDTENMTEVATTNQPATSVTITEPVIAPTTTFDLSSIPPFSGNPYIEINQNTPFFTEKDYTVSSYEYYSPFDKLGRCGFAIACIGQDIMPTEPRGEIGNVKPSGWQTVRYDDLIEDRYLYNRCHLIGYQLAGENDNPKNLITGTRYMNMTGMLPFENRVYDYVTGSGNHVLYRSTPIFEGNNLVATGVLIEAYSVEDNGQGVTFNVFVYNVQPGIVIDYATGDSKREEAATEPTTVITRDLPVLDPDENEELSEDSEVTYILNRNTGKFHYPSCTAVLDMKEKNKVYFYGTREEAIAKGYVPCKICHP